MPIVIQYCENSSPKTSSTSKINSKPFCTRLACPAADREHSKLNRLALCTKCFHIWKSGALEKSIETLQHWKHTVHARAVPAATNKCIALLMEAFSVVGDSTVEWFFPLLVRSRQSSWRDETVRAFQWERQRTVTSEWKLVARVTREKLFCFIFLYFLPFSCVLALMIFCNFLFSSAGFNADYDESSKQRGLWIFGANYLGIRLYELFMAE